MKLSEIGLTLCKSVGSLYCQLKGGGSMLWGLSNKKECEFPSPQSLENRPFWAVPLIRKVTVLFLPILNLHYLPQKENLCLPIPVLILYVGFDS